MVQADIVVSKVNGVHSKILCDASIAREISEKFKFRAPNFQFHPKFKARVWDGFIYIFNEKNRLWYNGLIEQLKDFAADCEYTIQFTGDFSKNNLTVSDVSDFISSLKIPEKYITRDYQFDTIKECINNKQHLFVSPTASGKSLVIYILARYFNKKTLIIVPRIQLVDQMYSDFSDYGFNAEKHVHKIYSGQEKDTDKLITISTWQSIHRMPKEWFKQYNVVFGDEAHKCKATEIKLILENLVNCDIRYGFTGSLDNIKTNKTILEGLFGPHKKIVSTKELIDRNFLSDLKINCLVLDHSKENRQLLKKASYANEFEWIVTYEPRNKLIKNLALELKGNTMILFQRVEKHGLLLYEMMQNDLKNKNLFLVHGKIKGEEREDIRKKIMKLNDSLTLASMGTFAEGINIPNLNNIILASPTKSRIWVMQMIGRGLRKTENKDKCNVYDISDDLSIKSWKNYTLKHYVERVKFYNEESFNYSQYKVGLR